MVQGIQVYKVYTPRARISPKIANKRAVVSKDLYPNMVSPDKQCHNQGSDFVQAYIFARRIAHPLFSIPVHVTCSMGTSSMQTGRHSVRALQFRSRQRVKDFLGAVFKEFSEIRLLDQ